MKRWWVKILLILAVIGCLPLLYLAEEHVRGACLLHSRLTQLHANHEPLSVAELTPKPVPEDQNAGAALLHLTNEITSARRLIDKMPRPQFAAPGRAVPPWKVDFWPDEEHGSISWADIENELNQNEALIAAIRSHLEKPGFDTHIDYAKGILDLRLPLLQPAKQMARLLSLSMNHRLRDGKWDEGIQDLLALIRFSVQHQRTPVVIAQSVRINIGAIAFEATWSALQAPGLTEAQLASLDAAWSGCEIEKDMLTASLMERAMTVHLYEDLRASRQTIGQFIASYEDLERETLGMASDKFATKGWVLHWINAPLWKIAWQDQDEARALDQCKAGIDSIRFVQSHSWQALNEPSSSMASKDSYSRDNSFDRFRFLVSSGNSFYQPDNVVFKAAAFQTECSMARTAIAIRRYELRQGRLPASLNDLAPAYLPSLPIDRMDGKPLRYHLTNDGHYLLYSVGRDGEDNGGNATRRNNSKAKPGSRWLEQDAVWPALVDANELP